LVTNQAGYNFDPLIFSNPLSSGRKTNTKESGVAKLRQDAAHGTQTTKRGAQPATLGDP